MPALDIFIYLATMWCIYAVAVLGLNVQFGLAGLANFGAAGFFGIGAYVSALAALAGLPPLLAMATAAAAAAAAGGGTAIVTSRLQEEHWAIATISFAEVVRLVALNEEWLTRGSFGIDSVPRPFAALGAPAYLVLSLLAAMLALLASELIRRSPFGRSLRLLRENEALALSLGKPVTRHRIAAMAAGSALIGISGALYVHFIGFVSPDDMTLLLTLVLWTMVVVGGKGNAKGVMLGALIIVLLFNSTRFLKDYVPLSNNTLASLRMVVIGVLLVVMAMRRPSGLVAEPRTAY